MKNINVVLVFAVLMLTTIGCFNDLNTIPIDEDIVTSATVYDQPDSYRRVLAKLYAGLAVTGQDGPAGNADIGGIDEGFGQYLRMLFYHQELTTDEAIIGWNDQTIADFHDQDWTASDGFIFAFYSRLYYQISLANEFLRQTTDAKLSGRGVDTALKAEVQTFRAEARFLRALSYWHALDHFRNVPFVTEDDIIGNFFPDQTSAAELFQFLESELKEIDSDLMNPRTNEYGRADKAAAWMLLSKLYLNANVYINTPKNKECLTYCEKVINAGYSLEPDYQDLFTADNNTSPEMIFPITFDGLSTRTYGGMTFLIKAGIGGTMIPQASGVNEGWGGLRTTPQLVQKFPSTGGGLLIDYNEGKRYPSIYVPGTFQGFDGTDVDNKIASVKSDKIYVGYRHFTQDNGEFSVLRFPNANLANQLGDSNNDGILETGGANIKVGPAGTYYITVDLNTNAYTFERVQWTVQGSAIEGGSQPLVWDENAKKLSYKGDLLNGDFKFVSDKGLVLGDPVGDALLAKDGAPIKINSAGGFEIYLDLLRPDYTYKIGFLSFDNRGMFYSKGQTLDIESISTFSNGYAVQKYRNIKKDGSAGKDITYPDTDFPVFRLADAYLMAAEAILRDNGDKAKALGYYNKVKERAFRGSVGNLTDINLDEILDERAREFYWECHRRTDLVRFGKFSSTDYLWQWKGGVKDGKSVAAFYDVFPLPSADLSANPNLQQNDGY